MDVGNRNDWRRDEVVPSSELLQQIAARWPVTPLAGSYHGEVAERYRYEDGAGEIGFISSVSAPFCGDCTRARLSSEGVFYTCLFATQAPTCAARCVAAPRTTSSPTCCAPPGPAARTATASSARRCGSASSRCTRSKCTTSADEQPIYPRRRAPAARDGGRGRQGRDAPHRNGRGARALPAGGGRGAARIAASRPARARCSTPRSSPA